MDIETSVEMLTGNIQDLPPPTTQEEVRRSQFRKELGHPQKVDVECFLVCRREKIYQKVGQLSGLGECTRTKVMDMEIT